MDITTVFGVAKEQNMKVEEYGNNAYIVCALNNTDKLGFDAPTEEDNVWRFWIVSEDEDGCDEINSISLTTEEKNYIRYLYYQYINQQNSQNYIPQRIEKLKQELAELENIQEKTINSFDDFSDNELNELVDCFFDDITWGTTAYDNYIYYCAKDMGYDVYNNLEDLLDNCTSAEAYKIGRNPTFHEDNAYYSKNNGRKSSDDINELLTVNEIKSIILEYIINNPFNVTTDCMDEEVKDIFPYEDIKRVVLNYCINHNLIFNMK